MNDNTKDVHLTGRCIIHLGAWSRDRLEDMRGGATQGEEELDKGRRSYTGGGGATQGEEELHKGRRG